MVKLYHQQNLTPQRNKEVTRASDPEPTQKRTLKEPLWHRSLARRLPQLGRGYGEGSTPVLLDGFRSLGRVTLCLTDANTLGHVYAWRSAYLTRSFS